MRIDKAQVVAVLEARGDHATAAQADMSLPSSLDLEKDGSFLCRFGVEPRDLVEEGISEDRAANNGEAGLT